MPFHPTTPTRGLVLGTLGGLILLAFRQLYHWEQLGSFAALTGHGPGAFFPFFFLCWNLLLAWIPYGLALRARALHRERAPAWRYWAVAFGWLLFWPNAPYLVTDLIHLDARPPVPLWFDALLLFSFAWTGILLAILSLRLMEDQWRERLGARRARAATWLALLAGCVGIFLGRVLRWNSWELFTRPQQLLTDLLELLSSPSQLQGAIAMSGAFFLFLAAAYASVPGKEPTSNKRAHTIKKGKPRNAIAPGA